MARLSKKDWINKLITAARTTKNANPFALGFLAYDALRVKMEGPLNVSGEQWYATHKDDPMGMNDMLSVPGDLNLAEFVQGVYDKVVENGGENFWLIPSEGVADVLKFLMSHPRFQGNLLDMDDEDPWDMPSIDFENFCATAENQFLSNVPIKVVFEYKDADTGYVIHRITLSQRDFWYFVDSQQMRIADRKW